MLFYFDVSCLNRPFDDQTQTRIRLEAEAVILLLDLVSRGVHQHVSSQMVSIEIAGADIGLQKHLRPLLPREADIMDLSASIFRRARELETHGFKAADAVHISAAEHWDADVLFTCDDRMCQAARRQATALRVKVANPLVWLQENP